MLFIFWLSSCKTLFYSQVGHLNHLDQPQHGGVRGALRQVCQQRRLSLIISLQDSLLKINVYFACDHLTIILIAITNIFLLLPFLIFLLDYWQVGHYGAGQLPVLRWVARYQILEDH